MCRLCFTHMSVKNYIVKCELKTNQLQYYVGSFTIIIQKSAVNNF